MVRLGYVQCKSHELKDYHTVTLLLANYEQSSKWKTTQDHFLLPFPFAGYLHFDIHFLKLKM